MKATSVFLFVLILSYSAFPQVNKYETLYGQNAQISVGYSNLIFINASKKYFPNSSGPCFNLMQYFNRKFFILSGFNGSSNFLGDSLRLLADSLFRGSKVTIENVEGVVGYRLVVNNNIFFDPYFGIARSMMRISKNEEMNRRYYTKVGFCSGLFAYWYLNPDNQKQNIWFLYLNSRFNYIWLNNIYNKFDNFTIQTEIGIGFKFNG